MLFRVHSVTTAILDGTFSVLNVMGAVMCLLSVYASKLITTQVTIPTFKKLLRYCAVYIIGKVIKKSSPYERDVNENN